MMRNGSKDEQISENIKVLIQTLPMRVKPRNSAVISPKLNSGWAINDHNRCIELISEKKSFSFDQIYSPDTPQYLIFEDIITETLGNAFSGYNANFIAFGEQNYSTNDKKSLMETSTMNNDSDSLLPTIFRAIFDEIDTAKSQDPAVSYAVEVNFIEIYREVIRDLFAPSMNKFDIMKPGKYQIYDENYCNKLTCLKAKSSKSIISAIRKANIARISIADTISYHANYRPHTLCTITIRKTVISGHAISSNGSDSRQYVSKINLVELGGNFGMDIDKSMSGAVSDGIYSDRSLYTFGKLVKAISSGKNPRNSHKDSVLTWLFRDSLAGNSKTTVLATVCLEPTLVNQSMAILEFASKLKRIRNFPTVNSECRNDSASTGIDGEIRKLREEISQDSDLSNVKLQKSSKIEDLQEKLLEYTETMEQVKNAWENRLSIAQSQYSLSRSASLRREKARSLKRISRVLSPENLSTNNLEMGSNISSMPFLVSLSEEDLENASFFYLPIGLTRIGSEDSQDIVIRGENIDKSHAVIEVTSNGSVWIRSACSDSAGRYLMRAKGSINLGIPMIHVDGNRLKDSNMVKLNSGNRVLFGKKVLFKLIHPEGRPMSLYSLSQKSSDVCSNYSMETTLEEEDRFIGSLKKPDLITVDSRSVLCDYEGDSVFDSYVRSHRYPSNKEYLDQSGSTSKASITFESTLLAAENELQSKFSEGDDKELKTAPPQIRTLEHTSGDDSMASNAPEKSGLLKLRSRKSSSSSNITETTGLSATPWVSRVKAVGLNTHKSPPNLLLDESELISTISIKVTGYDKIKSNFAREADYYVYNMQVSILYSWAQTSSDTGFDPPSPPSPIIWNICRRFREFYNFHKKLKKFLPRELTAAFPVKGMWKSGITGVSSEKLLERRKSGLQEYMNGVCSWWSHQYLEKKKDLDPELYDEMALNDEKIDMRTVENDLPLLSPRGKLSTVNKKWLLYESGDFRDPETSLVFDGSPNIKKQGFIEILKELIMQ